MKIGLNENSKLTTIDIKTLQAILYTVADYCNPVLSKRCLKS